MSAEDRNKLEGFTVLRDHWTPEVVVGGVVGFYLMVGTLMV